MVAVRIGRAALGLVGLLLASCTGEISAGPEPLGSSSEPLTINLADGFESGNLTTGGWMRTGDVTVVAAAARTGSFGARLGRDGVITTTINTTGFQNIQVTFDWRGVAIDLFESGIFEWAPPGGTFAQLSTTAVTTWGTPTITLPAGANNVAGVSIRLRVFATAFFEATWEGIDVDNVIVRGTAIAPPECTTDSNCAAGRICVAGKCVAHCGDGVRNGNETGIDCGGACPACPPPPTVVTLFSETFSSGLSRFALEPASRITTITGSAAYQSGPSAQLTVTAAMTSTVATTGHDNIVLRYVRGMNGLDAGEYFTSEVSSDGVTFTQVERVQTGALGAVSFALPATFANQPALRLRFRAQGSFLFIPETVVLDSIVLEGRPVMAGCTMDSQCSALDGACVRGACNAGVCVTANRAAGTACGSATSTACNAPDSCDGAGACGANLAAAGSACGDATSTACNAPDSCDGAGACNARLVAAGTACGSATNTACDAADSCNGSGTCNTNVRPAGTACGSSATSACDAADSCNGSGVCNANPRATGTSCGAAGRVCDSGSCVNCGSSNPASSYELIQTKIFDGYGCTGSVCHGSTGSGGLDLRGPGSWAHIFEVASSASAMDRVTPGDPDNSYLYRKLAWGTLGTPVDGGGPMPATGAPITTDELAGIEAWIEGGAPETGLVTGSLVAGLCLAPCATNADCSDGNACNGTETCQVATGQCVAGTALSCNDGVACTEDRCDPVSGCSNVLTAGLPCSGGVCNASGACVSCTPPANTYDAIQDLVFNSQAYGCRNGSCHGATMQGGLDLSPANSYSELFEPGRPRVVAGNAAASRLYDKLAAKVNGTAPATGGSPMPQAPFPAIASNYLAGIQTWINAGAPRTGVVPGTESTLCTPVTAPPANLMQVWDFPTSKGVTGKIQVVDGTVYASSWNGQVYALNRDTGAQRWSYNTGARAVQGGAVYVDEDGSIVVGDGEAVVRRLRWNGSSVQVMWSRDLDQTNADHIWQAVTIHDGTVFVPIASHSDVPCTKGRIQALRLSDGAPIWTRYNVPQGGVCEADTAIQCTTSAQCPGGGACRNAVGGSVTGKIVIDPSGQYLYANTVGCYTFPSVGDSDSIMKLDVTDGSTEWIFRTDPTEQFKYCFGGSAGGPGLPPGADCRTNSECNSNWCTAKSNQYHDFGFINGPHYVSAKTALGGTRPLIVSASKNGTVYALNASDGSIAWATSVLPAPISPTFAGYGLFNGALAYMNGTFYGALYQFSPAFSPAPEHLQAFSEVDGSVVWTDEIGISWSSVGAANGTVYTGTQASRSLYAYNGETGARLTTMSLPANSAAEPVVDGDMLFVGYGIDQAGGVRAYRILP